MAIEKGSAFLLKIGDGAANPQFTTVAGMRTTQMSVNGEAVVVTSKDSGGWRQLLGGAGVRSVSVSAAGVFTGSAAEALQLRQGVARHPRRAPAGVHVKDEADPHRRRRHRRFHRQLAQPRAPVPRPALARRYYRTTQPRTTTRPASTPAISHHGCRRGRSSADR